MKQIKYLMGTFLALAVACAPEEDVQGGSKFGQTAVLLQKEGAKVADFSSPLTISAAATDQGASKEISYQVKLLKENTENITASLELDNSQVEKYNKMYKKTYELLPEKYITYSKTLSIKEGNILSEAGIAKVLVSPELKVNTPYMFALSLSGVSGATLQPQTQTLLVAFEIVKGQIKNTVALTRDEYLEVDKSNSDLSDIGSTFTMEGLINVQKFRDPSAGDGGEAGISTFMGTEGKTLLRFGDSGVDPDHLQANGQDIGMKFKTNKWYHIAIVVDAGKTTIYVNGAKVTDFDKDGELATFFIGRSYSGGRGIVARFSEIRLWKIARTASQIKEGMLDVNPTTSGLYAYWKMNEVSNNQIPDVSGNNRPLILKGQKEKSGRQQITIHEEKTEVKIED